MRSGDQAVHHVNLVIWVGVCMCTLDGILIYCHKEQPHGLLAARKTLLYADLPALISFCVLLCYVFAIPFNSHIFVSGALAFQLFSSHIVFTAVEAEARMEAWIDTRERGATKCDDFRDLSRAPAAPPASGPKPIKTALRCGAPPVRCP